MATFQNIVMIVAIVMLIICLIFVGVALYNQKFSSAFPPVVADCPDYWLDKSDGDSSNCENVKNLGSDSCSKTMNFSTSSWTGDNGTCNKSRWARACDLTWDGVTNNNNVCDGIPTIQSTITGNVRDAMAAAAAAPTVSTYTMIPPPDGSPTTCTNNVETIEGLCSDNGECQWIGQQSNGCWHLLKADANGKATVSKYPKNFIARADF